MLTVFIEHINGGYLVMDMTGLANRSVSFQAISTSSKDELSAALIQFGLTPATIQMAINALRYRRAIIV